MEPEPAVDGPPPQARAAARKGPLAIILLAAALVAAAAFFVSYQRGQAEAAAVKALNDLGAIVVMDPGGSHAASVNLSTLSTADALAQAVKHLPALRHVTALDASRTSIGDDAMRAIGGMSGLFSLTLNETKLTDEGAKHLVGLSNLQALHLAQTEITNGGLNSLGKLVGLHILDLSATKVTGDFGPLAQLGKLEWLLLRELTLKDDALVELAPLQTLTHLSLEDAKYSEHSVAELKRALPKARVDRS
jgi:hypothetical protein